MSQKYRKPEIEFMNDCLLVEEKILVFSDVHIGYEDFIAGKGIFPRVQLKEMIEKLNGIFWDLSMRGIKIKEVVICGDLKQEFGEISEVEWRETIKFLDYLIEKCPKIILIRGNHDNILGPIAKKRGIVLKESYNLNGICFLHGDKKIKECERARSLIMGHLHPIITLSDGYKKERYRVFLRGKSKKKEIHILPSFSEINSGYDLKSKKGKKEFSVIDEKELEDFEVIIYNNKDKKEYNFGKLKKIN